MTSSSDDTLSDADAAAGNIREIVAMVKSGKINKSDAFNELRHLLKHSNSGRNNLIDENKNSQGSASLHDRAPESDIPPPIPSESVDFSSDNNQKNLPSSQSRFSKEDRRILINTLIEKKRRDRMQQSNVLDDDDIHSFGGDHIEDRYDRYDEINDVERARMDYDEEGDMQHSRNVHGFPGHEYEGNNQEGFGLHFRESMDASSISSSGGIYSRNSRERPRSAGRLGRSGSKLNYRSADFANRALDDSRLSDFRAQKNHMAESATRAEMFKECTFEPKIKDLPSSYGAGKERETHFYERVMRWQREKEIESTRRKTLSSQNEVVDCTFHPRISKNSQRSVKMTRGNSSKKDTPSRLYESNSQLLEQKSRYIEEQKQKEMEDETKECTFQPRINKSQAWDDIQPRYNKERQQSSPTEDSDENLSEKKYSFTPKVNEVRKSMNSAKLYLSMSVVDRLTKPIPPAPNDLSPEEDDQHFDSKDGYSDRPVMDVASFMGSLQGQGAGPYNTPGMKRPSSAGSARRRSTGSSTSSRHTLSAEEREQRNQSFQSFLGRQAQSLMKREKKIEEIGTKLRPQYKSHINVNSRKIVEESSKGDFLDRVQRDVLRREQQGHVLTAQAADSECSFRPEVSRRAESMRSRSVYELSRGDAHKLETSRRLLRLKSEQDELRNLTFQPRLATSPTRQARSALQLRDNPGGFMERHMNNLKQQDLERKKHAAQREKEELDQCTFAPKTRDCPAYVKRIARSLSVVKKSNSGVERPTRPQWK